MADSAILFEAILAWGADAADRVIGEFAFAWWNGAKRELLLGRDILGLRPIYYYRHPGFFAFASMPSGLHALEHVPYDVDFEFVAEQLVLLPVAGSKTYFAGISRVESGHVERIVPAGNSSRAYWEPPPPLGVRRSAAEYEEGLRSVLDQAVTAQLRSTGNVVASHLSGGLDSSAVTASAARLRPNEGILAFTGAPRLGFNGPVPGNLIADESVFAAQTAALYANIEHVVVRNNGESPLAWLDGNFVYGQEPMANLANAVWGQAIHRAARDRGANIILKAGAGNMTISYSGLECLPELLAQGRVFKFLKYASALSRNGVPIHSLGAQALGPFTPAWVWSGLRKLYGATPGIAVFSPLNRRRLAGIQERSRQRSWDLAGRPRRRVYESRLWAFRHADGGNSYKGVLAEWGLSVRDPTCDRRVIEYSLSVPSEEFLRGGVSRSLARRAFADRLPITVANSTSRGLQSADWFEALDKARPSIEREVASIIGCKGAEETLDFGWLKQCLDSWPSEGWGRADIYARFRLGLLRGIAAGHFIRKVRGTN